MSNSHSDQAPGQNKISTIIVNGRERQVSGQRISYSEVVALAYPGDQPTDGITYEVSYADPHGKDGTLVHGQDVHVKGGMIFNVVKTNRS